MISIGFYLSKDSLSIAELSFSGRQPRILSVNNIFFEDSQSEEDKLALLAKELDKMTARRKGKNIRLCYALPQNRVSSFYVEFPFKEKFKILKTLPYEIEDKTPFQLDRVCFDARICRIDKNKSSVLVFVTPEGNVKEFVNFTRPLKRNIHLLSCSSSALANLLESWNVPFSSRQNVNKESAFIYLGLENSLLLLYKEGFLNHVSILDWGCYGIITEMAKAYKLTREKAYEEFFTKAFILTQAKGFTKEQRFFSNLIKKKMTSFMPEFKLLKMSLETKQNQSFSKAVIFGPGAVIKNLSMVLTEELNLPVSKLKSFSAFPNFDLQSRPLTDIALGLALEGLKKSPYTGLNFLQPANKTAFSFLPKQVIKTAMIFIVCFILFSAYAFVRQLESSALLEKVNSIFTDYGRKIAYLRGNNIGVESIESFLASEKEKKEDEKRVRARLSLEQPIDYLQQIVQKIGSAENWNLRLQQLKIKGRTVEMRGQIESSSLKKFKALLQSLAENPIKEDAGSQAEKVENPMQEDAGSQAEKVENPMQEDAGSQAEKVENPMQEDAGSQAERAENPMQEDAGSQNREDLKEQSESSGAKLSSFSYSFTFKREF